MIYLFFSNDLTDTIELLEYETQAICFDVTILTTPDIPFLILKTRIVSHRN